MAIQWIAGDTFTCVSGDTKPTLVPADTKAIETNTDDVYRFNGTSWLLYLANDKTETLTNKTIDTDVNTLKLPFCSVLVYKAGTTYKAKDMESGATLGTTSTTDASLVINAAVNNIPGAAARGYGGRVFIHAGIYDCKTEIAMDKSIAGYQGIELEGEGTGTQLRFTPSSALTNGIRVRVTRPRLAHFMIYGNSNVTNLIRAEGQAAQTLRSDAGIIENLQFYGGNSNLANLDAEATYVSGQTGFLKTGAYATGATFGWKVQNCELWNLETGMFSSDSLSTSSFWNNIRVMFCVNGLMFSGGENNISNIYGTGGTNGRYLLRFLNSGGEHTGGWNQCTNIIAEVYTYALGLDCAAMYIADGCTGINYQNVKNNPAGSPFDQQYIRRVIDLNTWPVNHDMDRNFNTAPSDYRNGVMGWWRPGYQALGAEEGILKGNVAGTAPTMIAESSHGCAGRFTTAAAINSMATLRYNNPGGNNIERGQMPSVNVRFRPFDAAGVRIFIGLWDGMAAAPTTTSDILNAKKGVGLWVDTAVTTQWKVMHNDGIGASTVSAIAGNPTISSLALSRAYIYIYVHSANPLGAAPPGSPVIKANVICNNINQTVTTNLPPNATDKLGFLLSLENTTAGAKFMDIWDIEMRTDI